MFPLRGRGVAAPSSMPSGSASAISLSSRRLFGENSKFSSSAPRRSEGATKRKHHFQCTTSLVMILAVQNRSLDATKSEARKPLDATEQGSMPAVLKLPPHLMPAVRGPPHTVQNYTLSRVLRSLKMLAFNLHLRGRPVPSID